MKCNILLKKYIKYMKISFCVLLLKSGKKTPLPKHDYYEFQVIIFMTF